jgi:hypothetical protein
MGVLEVTVPGPYSLISEAGRGPRTGDKGGEAGDDGGAEKQ